MSVDTQLHVEWETGLMAVVTPTGEVVGYLGDWLASHDRKWRTQAEEQRIRADERAKIAAAIRSEMVVGTSADYVYDHAARIAEEG